MKIKLFQSAIFLIAISFIFTSCKKKLDEENPSGLTSETVFSNAAGFETLVSAAYTFSRFWYGKEEGISLSEMGTDIWTSGTGDVFPQLSQYNNLQGANTNSITTLWNNTYAAINLCNTGIVKIADVPDYSAAQKTSREAELRFLRAFYYWHIVETWGGVHFTTQPTEGVITTANRTPVDTFYNLIINDLKFAVANLPATNTQYGRATQPVAKAFLSRMYLTRGQNAEATAMANDVIRNYGLILQPRFVDLWNMGNLKSKEIIWAVDYSTVLTFNDLATATFPNGHPRGSNSAHLLHLMVYDQALSSVLIRDIPNGRPFNRYMPTIAFLKLFDETNDARYQGSFQTLWRVNRAGTGFAIGDTAVYCAKVVIPPAEMASRKYVTFDLAKVYGADGVPIQRRFYVSLSKMKDSTRLSTNEAQSARDAFVMRLAEMYLIAAEASLKQGKADSAAYYINIIRRRAAIPGREANMVVAASDMTLDYILDERARELCGEQLRWFDLKRTNKLISRIQSMNPDAAKFIQPYHMLRPIPQTQIDAVSNKSEFTQNPGYN
jgi:starch-binding outer membrane protein, SusD/RagB family